MPEELRHQLASVRSRLKADLWKGGLSACLAGSLLILLLAAFLDWLLMSDSLSGRIFLSVTALLAFAWLFLRELWKPLTHPLSDLWLAQRIEQNVPELSGQLTSTVEFSSQQYDHRFGSAALQKQSVDTTIRKILTLDLLSVINPRPVRLRARTASVLLAISTLLVVCFPAHAWTAMQRIVQPWQTIEWPREVQLQVQNSQGEPVDSKQLAGQLFSKGQTLEFHVVNLRGELPDDLELLLRSADGELRRESIPRNPGGAGVESFGQLQLTLRDSFEFRVRGGDDDHQPWYEIEVVPPPVLSELKLTVVPPEYSDREAFEISAGSSFVQTLVGSMLVFEGVANVPLTAAELFNSQRDSTPLNVDPGSALFSGELLIRSPGNQFFRLQLTDESGISNNSAVRLEISGQADRTPEIHILQPVTDQFLTPQAELQIDLSATDDVGLTDLALTLARESSDPADQSPWIRDLLDSEEPVTDWETTLTLRLEELGFAEGDLVRMRFVGQDALSLDGEHQGIDERLLTLVSPAEKRRELSERLQELIDQIERSADRQSLLNDSFEDLTDEKFAESFPGILSDQKRIERHLLDDQSSLQFELQKLIEETERNQLDEPRFRQRLTDLDRDFRKLDEQQFPQLNQLLGRLDSLPADRIDASQPLPDRVPTREELHDPAQLERFLRNLPAEQQFPLLSHLATGQQEEIRRLLRDMTGSLAEWKQQRSLQDSLSELIENQKDIGRDAQRLNSRLLGKSLNQLNPADREHLQQLAADQLRNQTRLRNFEESIERELENPNPLPQLKDLQQSVESSEATSQMSDNQRALRENHLSEAGDLNDRVLEQLKEWDDQLNNRPVTDSELKMQMLEEQSRRLDQLARDQQELSQNMRQQPPGSPAENEQRRQLGATQQELKEQAGSIRRTLERLQLPAPADSLQSAEQSMQNLTNELERELPEDRQTREPEDKLAEAQQAIERERRQLDREHQEELLRQLLPRLKELARRQREINRDATKLQADYLAAERWNRSLLKVVNGLRDRQQASVDELRELRQLLEEVAAVRLAADRLLETMDKARQQLAEREVADALESSLPRILRELEILIEVLQRSPSQDNQNADGEQPDDSQNEDEEQNDTLYVELLLLRAVQQQIQEQSRDLSKRESEQGANDGTQAEWRQLEFEQAEVLKLLEELLTEKAKQARPGLEEVI